MPEQKPVETPARGAVDFIYYFFDKVFNIRREEFGRVMLMFVYFMLAIGALLISRTVRDTLFLSRYDLSQLPYMYIGIAVIVSLVSMVYSRLVTRFSTEKTIYIVSGFLLVSLLAFRFAFSPDRPYLYPAFYIWAEVLATLVTIQFWNFANSQFNSREAKRLFGFIAGGQVIGNLLVGWLVGVIVAIGTTEDLLFLGAIALAGCIAIVATVSRKSQLSEEEEMILLRRGKSSQQKKKQGKADPLEVFRSPYTFTILMIVAATFIVTTFIDYQFKVVAQSVYKEGELARFFGLFYAFVGTASFFIQFFLTGRILERFGILVSLLVMPVSFLVGTVAMIFRPSLLTATFTKFCENALRYTINDPTTQLLFIPIQRGFRERSQAFLYGTVKPLTIGLAGLMLLFIADYLDESSIGYFSLAMLLVWILAGFRIKRQYIINLVQGLKDRRLNLEDAKVNINDDLTLTTLLEALDSPDENQVIYALDMIEETEISPKLAETIRDRLPIERLLEHPSPRIRATALGKLAAIKRANSIPLIIKRFSDQDIQVKAQAVRALIAVGGEEMLDKVESCLDDLYPEIQAASVTGLILYGGIDGVLLAAPRLKTMVESDDPIARQMAAQVLGDIEIRHFDGPLLKLLGDEERTVRLAAIEAAPKIKSPRYIPLLIEQLADQELASEVITSLAAYGDEVIPPLEAVLIDDSWSVTARNNVPRVIGQIDSVLARQTLVRHIDHPDTQICHRVITNLGRVRAKLLELDEESIQFIKSTIISEIKNYYELLNSISAFKEHSELDLLAEALNHRAMQNDEHIFRLLSLLYPSRTIFTVFYNLKSEIASERANAIEVIDNLIENDLKRPLMPIVENRPLQAKLKVGAEYFGIKEVTLNEVITMCLENSDEWLKICALYSIGQSRLAEFAGQVTEILENGDTSIVRETALYALSMIYPAEQMRKIGGNYVLDKDQLVRGLAERIVKNPSPPPV